ncbi:response regulator transcription factor [Paenibacillus ehimensis]|uniref:response regulator transcription factor n=1 Tax=Paenibacillus ehimensis TaxID=79264 RepID=UPI0004700FD8|nr:response regulator [Paenibacillus ehimensis]
MFRVLLVDDEPIARIGLRTTFDWESNGLRLVGEASNGKRAMLWIERNEVDILITDIAMPVMDGLELMRAAREKNPLIKVVLLSCHNDFEYVREGIRLGASDYLLKPTLETADLKSVLDKLKEQISLERKKEELYLRQELSGKRIETEKALVKLLGGEELPSDLRTELCWLEERYRVVVCLLDGAAKLRAEEGGVFIEIMLDEVQASYYEHRGQGVAFRVCADKLVLAVPDEGDQEAFRHSIESFQTVLKQKGYGFTMGISSRVQGCGLLKRAYREGEETARLRFYFGPGSVSFYSGAPLRKPLPEDAEGCRNALKETMREGFRDKAALYVERILRYWTCEYRTPAEVMREAQELLSLFHLSKGYGLVPIEQTEAVRMMESVEEMRAFLWSAFEAVWMSEDEMEEEYGFHRRIIEKAIDYMKSNFTKALSLQDVADHVAVSKNYFSEMFKRVTGQNFIDYLIHLRLKRSSVLLQTTALKVYEVAEMSGFNDVKYFSKVFKKTMKMSPAEFRERRGGNFGIDNTFSE